MFPSILRPDMVLIWGRACAAPRTHTPWGKSYSKRFGRVNVRAGGRQPCRRRYSKQFSMRRRVRTEAMAKSPDWEETLADLARRRQHARAMGGPERLDKHRGKGKLDARARIERLL